MIEGDLRYLRRDLWIIGGDLRYSRCLDGYDIFRLRDVRMIGDDF
jgi:hypothetical protein